MERGNKSKNKDVSRQEGYKTINPYESDDESELEDVEEPSIDDQIIVQYCTKRTSDLVDFVMEKENTTLENVAQSCDDSETDLVGIEFIDNATSFQATKNRIYLGPDELLSPANLILQHPKLMPRQLILICHHYSIF